jgi:hypothetical protein
MPYWKVTVLLLISLLMSVSGRTQVRPTSPTPASSKPPASLPNKTQQIRDIRPIRVEFLRDIAPLLDKNSCSTAECHGKFGGRGDLQLSLLTLSPEDDYEPLVYGERGRRVNFAAPEKSLLLLKATGQTRHKGGMRFPVNSPAYKTMLQWLKDGAPFDAKDPRLVTLVLKPEKVTFQKTGQTQKLQVLATYTDGSRRDVTAQTVFSSTNDAVLKVSPSGNVTGTRWGGGAILGRYLGTVSAAFFTLPQARKGKYPTLPTANVLDKLVFDNLKRMNILPSGMSSDAEFLRRVTLDTLGRLPTPDEIKTFLADKSQSKRAKTIDALLERPEFADLRSLRLADLLRVHPRKLGQGNQNLAERATALFYEWIWKSVRDNKPWDQFVKELLLSRGSTFQNGPANFYRIENAANDRMENLGQAFLGVRMSCARCHKHPFDRWNTDDYWNFSAFFAKVGLRGGSLLDENEVVNRPNARLTNQSVTGRNRGKVAPPTYLGEKQPAPESPDAIAALADWITDGKNSFFARATVNRLWSYYFGRGIIHPVDDMRPTTPESVPDLIDALATELVRHKYDIKHVIRLILNSRTYQLSAIPNASNRQDDVFFSRFPARPMPAQVLLDMLNQAAGVNEEFGTYPERTRAVQAVLPVGNYFLNAFGQSHREFLADIDPKLEPNLVQTLHMINSPYVNNKIQQGSAVAAVVKETKTDAELIEALYLRTFSRLPTPAETAKATILLKTATDRKEGASDLLWALLTSREFYFNH